MLLATSGNRTITDKLHQDSQQSLHMRAEQGYNSLCLRERESERSLTPSGAIIEGHASRQILLRRRPCSFHNPFACMSRRSVLSRSPFRAFSPLKWNEKTEQIHEARCFCPCRPCALLCKRHAFVGHNGTEKRNERSVRKRESPRQLGYFPNYKSLLKLRVCLSCCRSYGLCRDTRPIARKN